MSEMNALLRKLVAELEPRRIELMERMQSNAADAADYALYTQIRKTQILAQPYITPLNRALTP